jgi:hypothetical protein
MQFFARTPDKRRQVVEARPKIDNKRLQADYVSGKLVAEGALFHRSDSAVLL